MTKLAGILNITPDSFSDGGKYSKTKNDVLTYAEKLIVDGVDIIDIGAESTRPDATMLTADEEWTRLSPVINELINLTHKNNKQISLDSYHTQNIKKAIDLGIDFINDVSGINNKENIELLKKNRVPFVLTHNLGLPASKDITIPDNENIIAHLNTWILEIKKITHEHNINLQQIIIDPGIGFGKTAKQSIEIINNIEKLNKGEFRIYIGHSKKSFLNYLYPKISQDRSIETLEVSKLLINKNIDFLRVHDIAIHREYISNLQKR